MNKKIKKIGIDARLYGPKGKGLGRYVQKLIQHLEEIDGNNDSNHHYFIFLKKENFNLYNPRANNFEKVEADYHWYTFSEQIFFLWILIKFRLDLVHFLHFNFPIFYPKKFIVTIHDLILFHFPTIRNSKRNRLFYWIKLTIYYGVIYLAGHRASRVIAVSDFTNKDLQQRLHLKGKKIKTIYEGADFQPQNKIKKREAVLKKYGIMNKYLLYVGNAYPHKNLEKLIEVFDILHKDVRFQDFQLVLVGDDDYFYLRLKGFVKKRLIKSVVFCGFVPDDELEVLYERALRYVFPSLYEGFGLPPLEAMMYGTPVISSNASCLPEILGEEEIVFFDPTSKFSMLRKIKESLAVDYRVSEKKIKKIKQRFDWHRMARETLEEYKKL